jgi:DnaJ-domain-containing protein 1
MRSERAVVEAASQLKDHLKQRPVASHVCAFCANASEVPSDYLTFHICAACGKPQPLVEVEDFFSAFGIARGFTIDMSDLERRFYAISRQLHPDRFASEPSDSSSLTHSLARMSFLNDAYRTLKNCSLLRAYILKLECVEIGKNKPDLELTESWFEIQDLVLDDPTLAAKKASELKVQLLDRLRLGEEKMNALEKKYDACFSQGRQQANQVAVELAAELQAQSYLLSLQKDLHSKVVT